MPATTIVIFGASGDLTARKLIPALFRLHSTKYLPTDCRIVGISRTEHTSEQFRELLEPGARNVLSQHGEWPADDWREFSRRLHYVAGDAAEPEGMMALDNWLREQEGDAGGNRLYYFAVFPELYRRIIDRLGEAGMESETDRGFRRVLVEKPFGRDAKSARDINEHLHLHFREEQIYRIDHYLGKDTVQNILVFRLANSMFEPLWNRRYIDHVQITVAESLTVGNRAKNYDTSGVLRDMFQSHLLQVLTMVAMESPSRFLADRLRNEKAKVLDSVLVPTIEEARESVALGQYAGYRNEREVPQGSRTPTYAAVKLMIENWRWKGVPFYLRSGKGLSKRYSEVVIQFREPPFQLFPRTKGNEQEPNRLTIVLQPNERIQLSFQTKIPSIDGNELQSSDLFFDYARTYGVLPEAYERLLLDALQGDASLFMRADEIERAWEIMEPFLQVAQDPNAPLPNEYAQGSAGPVCADELIARDGRRWRPIA